MEGKSESLIFMIEGLHRLFCILAIISVKNNQNNQ